MNINKELIFKESLPFFKNLSKEEKNILMMQAISRNTKLVN